MTINERLNLIKQVGEEIVSEDELVNLLSSGKALYAYDGFEPSGKIHIAQGLIRAINVNKITEAGLTFKMLIADWHAAANHKFGGDLAKIKLAGQYFEEVWRVSGMNLDKVQFVYDSDLKHSEGYWDLVLKISTILNLPRVLRTTQIMGRAENDSLTASQILYPLMQATDIFKLGVDICQLGMDQRKVNMLAREIAEELGFKKPVVVSHHMLQGLLSPTNTPLINTKEENKIDRSIRLKMSKSNPSSAIFMTDSVDEVNKKIANAWCPEGIALENPILEYCKYLVFAKEGKMLIKRLLKFGGDIEYTNYNDLEKDFINKKLFPLDLKNSLAEYINTYLQPIRVHFTENTTARTLKEKIESFAVSR